MIIEFRVQNFRSLKDEQVLSFVATKDKSLFDTNTFSSGVNAAPSLLSSAVVYGANASGKSNIIRALQYMRGVIVESFSRAPEQLYNVQPFLIDSESRHSPTSFEASFIINEVRYQYAFEMTSRRIISESLLVYKAFKPQKWFERNYNPKTERDEYVFSPNFKGQKSVWEKATRPDTLFLSRAVQLNSEQLQPVFDWFSNKLIIYNDISPLNQSFSVNMLGDKKGKEELCYFLNNADISIKDIQVVSKTVEGKSFHFNVATGESKVEELGQKEVKEILCVHQTDNGDVTFNFNDESLGTQRLFFIAGPILGILRDGYTLVVDELDSSLHPALVRRLVKLFHSHIYNSKGAQLFFSTHDTSLLDMDLFRRDQIWFTEKDRDQATTLYPLSEFSPRKKENLERGYLMGRYGALPFFQDFMS